MWQFVIEQTKTSTVALRLLYHMYQKGEPWFQEKRLCQETLLRRKDQNLSCCRRHWKHLVFTSAGKTRSMGGRLLLWSFQHLSLRAQTPVLQSPTPTPNCGQCDAQTWADDPSILLVSAVVLPPAPGRARPHMGLISSAVQVIQPDGPWPCPEVSRPRGIDSWSTVQLPAHHVGIVQVPAVITDGAPGALVKDLHSPGAGTTPVYQAKLSAVWGERNGTMGRGPGE